MVELALGTVQWGMAYGITNRNGQICSEDVRNIVRLASKKNIAMFDTAPAYGCAEELLGAPGLLPDSACIVTKSICFNGPRLEPNDLEKFKASFADSLQRLRRPSIYGFLIHHAEDLLAEGGEELYAQMLLWKKEGWVSKIGVSVYDPVTLRKILDRFVIDLVQVPLSVFDQRMLCDGFLSDLHSRGIEIHARSIFLQGLLLVDPKSLPGYFEPFHSVWQKWGAILKRFSLSPVQGALAFIRSQPVSAAIVGISSEKELAEISSAWSVLEECSDIPDFDAFSNLSEQLIDPRRWPSDSSRLKKRS